MQLWSFPMRDRGSAVLWLAVLGLIGWKALPSTSPQAADDHKGVKVQAPDGAGKEERHRGGGTPAEAPGDFLQPLVNFFDTGKSPAVPDNPADWKTWVVQRLKQCEWDPIFLIATVPDPADSSSGYRFDSVVDAIQRAIEGQHFGLDNYYFPWTEAGARSPHPDHPSGAAEYDLTLVPRGIRIQRKADRLRSYERQPGTLLFRYNRKEGEKKEQLLIVFLVGETATGGVHRLALKASLDFVTLVSGQKPLYLLGPYFSGSQTSVAQTVREWLTPKPRDQWPKMVRVMTGSATAVDLQFFPGACCPEDVARVKFNATVIPEDIIFDELLAYLKLSTPEADGHYQVRENIALLYESNTTFGQNFGKRVTDKAGRKGQESAADKAVVLFPFPMHISDVRVGYGKAEPVPLDVLPSLPTFGRKLRIPPQEGTEPRDVEPSLRPSTTAATDERVLAAMLTAIQHERFHYVAIAATDLKDKLFLATLVRQHCPGVRLLFTSNHLLLSHPDYSTYLKGAIVGSTYPLYARNQRWSFPYEGSNREVFFPGEEEQGCYNATVALLAEQLQGCHEDARDGRLLEYGPPFVPFQAGLRPPIWVSVICQTGPEPLGVISGDEFRCKSQDRYEKYVYAPQREPLASSAGSPVFNPQPNSFWITPFLALTVFVIVVGVAYGGALVLRGRQADGGAAESRFWMVNLFTPRSRWRGSQRFYVLICLGSAGLLYLFPAVVCDIPLASKPLGGAPAVTEGWQWLLPSLTLGILIGLLLSVVLRVAVWLGKAGPAVWRWMRRRGADLRKGLTALPGWLRRTDVNPLRSSAALRNWLGRRDTNLRKGLAAVWGWLGRRGDDLQEGLATTGGWLLRPLLSLSLLLLLVAVLYLARRGPEWPKAANLPERSLLFFERATNLSSGVSPVVPWVLLGLGFFWWAYARLKRLFLLDRHRVEPPFPPPNDPDLGELNRDLPAADVARLRELNDSHRQLQGAVEEPHRAGATGKAWVIWLIVLFTFCRLASRFSPTVEGAAYDSLLLLGLAIFCLCLVHALLELLSLWKALRRMLQEIAKLPMRQAYARIPRRVTRMFGPFLSSERPGHSTHLEDRGKQRELLLQSYAEVRFDLQQAVGYSDAQLAELDRGLEYRARGSAASCAGAALRAQLTRTSMVCFAVLCAFWKRLSLGEALGDPPPDATGGEGEGADMGTTNGAPATTGRAAAAVAIRRAPAKAGHAEARVNRWRGLVEDFVALEIVTYLAQFFAQLRNLLLFLTGGALLLLVTVASYPLEPQRLWLLLAGVLAAAIALAAIRMFVQIERDDVVSRVSGTTPNRINWLQGEFLKSVLVYAVPLLAVLLAASTDLSDLLHAWFDPVFQVLR
jgi:hypothetical protein